MKKERCLKISETILFRKFKVVLFQKTLECFSAGLTYGETLERLADMGVEDFSSQLTAHDMHALLGDAEAEIRIAE